MLKISSLVGKIIKSSNERQLSSYRERVEGINGLAESYAKLSDGQLRELSEQLGKRHRENGESLDNLLVESYALVREASERSLGMRHFDVQLLGGMVLHEGNIAEMKTGEGKTLVATLASYLNALGGKGVHIVTVNDYLARRDAEWMGKLYSMLGLRVGLITGEVGEENRKEEYEKDIIYATNNELGFDYLRDNLKGSIADLVQRELNYAIVDEVDSILIDEARTPLIISGALEGGKDLYALSRDVVSKLGEGDYELDEKQRTASFTDKGIQKVEEVLEVGVGKIKISGSLYDLENLGLLHHLNQSLKASVLFKKDKDYIVKKGEVIIIDEFTGRMMEGRRYSDGLHQAIESKERVEINKENQTLASVTYQNYFRSYNKLAGMTGTALTEEAEFGEIYNLAVVGVPTNQDMIREDNDDEIYRTSSERDKAVIGQIKECKGRGQPVLVGTVSIERSEKFSRLLKREGISHEVLNARNHEKEAEIIAQAGSKGAVTIATNMAGRGTDIKLGGNLEYNIERELQGLGVEEREVKLSKIRESQEEKHKEVLERGGLYVLGTERHESRRIDNQLRGRSGRQGDKGESKFYVALDDDLMRIFGSERLGPIMQKLGLSEGESINHAWINKAIEKAQKKVEAHNFDIRKHLLKFDDVINDQRKAIFTERQQFLRREYESTFRDEIFHEVIGGLLERAIGEKVLREDWNIEYLRSELQNLLVLDLPILEWYQEEGVGKEELHKRIEESYESALRERREGVDKDWIVEMECALVLHCLDKSWQEHLQQLDYLRQGIGLRAYGQRDPLNEYKQEAYILFAEMLNNFRRQALSSLMRIRGLSEEETRMLHEENEVRRKTEIKERLKGVPRNSLCPCGSGLKYKHCCGKL